jgi:hypothetical protein
LVEPEPGLPKINAGKQTVRRNRRIGGTQFAIESASQTHSANCYKNIAGLDRAGRQLDCETEKVACLTLLLPAVNAAV